METSARNQLAGTVLSVSLGAVMAEVTIDVNGATVVAAITKESAERLETGGGPVQRRDRQGDRRDDRNRPFEKTRVLAVVEPA